MNISDLLTVKKSFTINNSSPLAVKEEKELFIVETGILYLFAVTSLEGGLIGARYEIASFEPGDLFFILNSTEKEQFILIGAQNTTVSLIDPASFFLSYRDHSKLFDGLLSKWINKVCSNLLQGIHIPKIGIAIEKDGSFLPDVTLYSPLLHWVKVDENLVGFNNLPLQEWTGAQWFPVTGRQVVFLKEEQALEINTTISLIDETGSFPPPLSGYIRKLSSLLLQEKFESLEKEDQNIHEKFERSDLLFSNSLNRIKQVVDLKSDELDLASSSREALLFETAKIVAASQEIKLHALLGKNYTLEGNGVQELAKDNSIRVREVLLRDEWWKEDNGPLLCNWQNDVTVENLPGSPINYTPVALIPNKGKNYQVINLENGMRALMKKEDAEHIAPLAYMFYRSLPKTKISMGQILKFGSVGLKADIKRYVFLGIMGTLIGLLIPEMTKLFIDTIIPEAAKNRMVQISFLLFISTLAAGAFEFVKGLAMVRLETKSDFALQAAIWDRVMKLKVPFFRDFTAGDLSERSMAISQIRRILSGTVMTSMMSFLFSLVYLFQIFRYSPELTRTGLLLCLLPISVTILVSFFQYRYEKEVAELQGSITGVLLQFMMGVAKLNITSSEKRAFGVWAEKFSKKKQMAFKSGFVNNIHSTFVSFFPLMVSMFLYMKFMGSIGKPEAISTGTFLAFIASFTAFQASLIGMTTSLTQSINVIPLYKRAKPILDAELEISESKPSVSSLEGNIEINHVNFRYNPDGPLILKDVSLKVKPREFVALVGSSGSGKSTLLRLLLGFEKPESGSIYYDNQDIESLDITSIRRKVGVVLQNGSIMQGSIYKNIVGSSPLTIEDAWEAAKMVGFDEDINSMPMGMHTEIPAGGGTLSGGQRQRLIIARAIIHRPNILFFDEATSALDNKTQDIVSKSLKSLNVARVVIAHRLSTIIEADSIYVLEEGVLRESGSYSELMARGGLFADLAKRQQV